METMKQRYESPELDELAVNAFTVIAGATTQMEKIEGDIPEDDLDD